MYKHPFLLLTACVGPRVYPTLPADRKLCATPIDQLLITRFSNLSIPPDYRSETDPEFNDII